MTTSRRFIHEMVENIYVPLGHRPARVESVASLAESMRSLGLLTPILVRHVTATVTMDDGEVIDTAYHLVAGRHRLAAAKLLGWKEIECEEVEDTNRRVRMMEIAENLHRADLTELERAEQITEWLRLAHEEEANGELKLAQLGPKPGRPESGVRAAARDVGIERHQAQRATKIEALTPEAKTEAQILHLDNNQSVLLKAAKKGLSPEEQLRVLRAEAAKRADKSEASASERRVEAAVTATKKLSPEELAVYADWFAAYREDGGAVFDSTAVGKRAGS